MEKILYAPAVSVLVDQHDQFYRGIYRMTTVTTTMHPDLVEMRITSEQISPEAELLLRFACT